MPYESFNPEEIERHLFLHTFRANGTALQMPVPIRDNLTLVGPTEVQPVILIPGLGETRRVAEHALIKLAEVSIPAISLEIDYASAPKNLGDTALQAVERITREVPVAAAQSVIDDYGTTKKLEVISNSLGGALQGAALAEEPGLYGNQVFINPLGLTAGEKGKMDRNNAAFFLHFLRSVPMKTSPLQRGIYIAGIGVAGELYRHVRSGTFNAELTIANKLANGAQIAEHSTRNRVSILSGGKDTLFPSDKIRHEFKSNLGVPHEICHLGINQQIDQRLLTTTGLNLISVGKLPHANFSMKAGQRMIQIALQSLGSTSALNY